MCRASLRVSSLAVAPPSGLILPIQWCVGVAYDESRGGFLDGQGRGKQRGGWVESGIPKHSPAVGFGTAPEPARQCSFRITPYEVGESTSNSVLRVSDKKNRQEYSAWSDKCAQTCHAGNNSPAPSNIRKIPRGGEVLLPRIPMRNYRALTFPISPLGISMSTSNVDTDLPRSILI